MSTILESKKSILMVLAIIYLLNSTALVSFGQEACYLNMALPMERNLLRASSLRLREWEGLHAVPSQGVTTSGRNKARMQKKGGQTSWPRRRYMYPKVQNWKEGSFSCKSHSIPGRRRTALRPCRVICTVVFWVGLSVVCNLYGYNKLHA